MHDVHALAIRSIKASRALSALSCASRNKALRMIAEALIKRKELIFQNNQLDLDADEASNLHTTIKKRLRFDESKLAQVCKGLEDVAASKDPLGITTLSEEITPGLDLYRVTCPIGVIGVIFESRPDALVQIASLTLKSGNAVLLKGGTEARNTNRVLCSILQDAAESAGIPRDFALLLETRDDVKKMLQEDECIDLIIPRGSNALVRYIKENTRIPVLGHSDGICHVYIDNDADLDMALNIAVDSKIQNVSVCNAEETLLVHKDIASTFLPQAAKAFERAHVQLVGDPVACSIIGCEPACDADWSTEYLDYKLSIAVVPTLEAAINHINHYGSHHTDCIVTHNEDHASIFLSQVDSSSVYVNCSTRFADGFVYGFGAEVGIATGKIHARGPMGMEGLTTYKYKLIGHGQTMQSKVNGDFEYTHQRLERPCPY